MDLVNSNMRTYYLFNKTSFYQQLAALHLPPSVEKYFHDQLDRATSPAECNQIIQNARNFKKTQSPKPTTTAGTPTKEQFKKAVKALKLPWSDAEINKMYDLCIKNGINTKESMASLLATIAHEQPTGQPEKGDKEQWDKDYANGKKSVPWDMRGGGYIQLTGKDTYDAFFKEMGITPPTNGKYAEYVSNNYAAEAAVWFWTTKSLQKFPNQSINDMIKANNPNPTNSIYTHMAASYAVQSQRGKSGSYKSEVASGQLIKNDDGTFSPVSDKSVSFPAPNGWETTGSGTSEHIGRKPYYNTAREAFGFST